MRKWHKKILSSLDKRQRFALQTVILTGGLIITQLIWEDIRLSLVVVLAFLSYILSAWSLKEDIKGVEWLLLFILPVFFTSAVSMFYFLLPARMITRVIITVLYAIGSYAVLLVENIFNVAAERSVPLLRVAHTVGLLLSLVTIFLSANVVYSLRLPFSWNLIFISSISFPLALQMLWTTKLEDKISKRILLFSGVTGIGMGEIALALSFWPVNNASFSLLLTATFYSQVGIFHELLMERLFSKAIREYLFVFGVTLLLIMFVTKWGGE